MRGFLLLVLILILCVSERHTFARKKKKKKKKKISNSFEEIEELANTGIDLLGSNSRTYFSKHSLKSSINSIFNLHHMYIYTVALYLESLID